MGGPIDESETVQQAMERDREELTAALRAWFSEIMEALRIDRIAAWLIARWPRV